MNRFLFALVPMVFATPAFAQSQPQVDPRLAAPMVQALRAELALSNAAILAIQEDAAKREAAWAEYSKSLWQAPEPEPAK